MMTEAKKWMAAQLSKNQQVAFRPAASFGANGISLDTIRSIEWLHANAVLISYETDKGMKQLQIDSDASSLKWLVEALSQRLIGISLNQR